MVWHSPIWRVQKRRWWKVLAVARALGSVDHGHPAESGDARHRLGRHRAKRSVANTRCWKDVGTDQSIGDAAVIADMVLSAETGYSSRSLDRVPPARAGTALGCDRSRRARVHGRWGSYVARPRVCR